MAKPVGLRFPFAEAVVKSDQRPHQGVQQDVLVDRLGDHAVHLGLVGLPEWRFLVDSTPVGVRLRPRLTTSTTESAIAAVKSGFGIASLYAYQVDEALRNAPDGAPDAGLFRVPRVIG